MPSDRQSVIILEDDEDIADFLAQLLTTYGVYPIICHNEQEVLQALKDHAVALALLDIMLPAIDGRNVAETLRKHGVSFPIYFMTGIRDEDLSETTRALADGILHKPFTVNKLKSILDGIFSQGVLPAAQQNRQSLLEIMANLATERESLRRRRMDLCAIRKTCSAQNCSAVYEQCQSITLALEASLERIAKELEAVLRLLDEVSHA